MTWAFVGLTVFMRVRATHQLAVRISQIDLPVWRRFIVRRFRWAATPSPLRIKGRFPTFILGPGGLALLAGTASSRAQASSSFAFSNLAAGQFVRQGLMIRFGRIRCLCPLHQGGDVGGQFLA
ncbi:hypothetical protein MSKU15_0164 [Komagataeibacter diospyri]|nr:hypothetical protein MSKU15_0164 [Komagataeibacter diospyri]